MKHSFYTALFAFLTSGTLSGTAVAQTQSYSRNDCELILESVDNTLITAEINGRRFNRTATTLRFGNMPPGRKNIIIYRVNGHRNDGGASARIIWEGRLITKRGVQTIGSVEASTGRVRFQNYRFDEMPYSSSRQNNAPNDRPDPGNVDAREDLTNYDKDPGRQEDNRVSSGTISDTEARWNNLEKTVNSKITDTDKLKALREAIGKERISTANLRRSMGWLNFESTKLQWAQYKVADVADPENLGPLSSEFTFSSNRKAFKEAVAKVQR